MISKLIFVSYIPLQVKLEQDFFIQEIIKKGIIVEYWDLTEIYFKNLQIEGSIERPYIKKFQNLLLVEQEIDHQNLENTIFCPIITYEFRVLKLFRILTKHHCQLCFFDRRGLPYVDQHYIPKRAFLDRVKCGLNLKKMAAFLKKYISKMYLKFHLVKEYDLVFVSGELGKKKYNPQKTTIVCINHFDYDHYLIDQATPNDLIAEKYMVFLDEYLPYHPDNLMLNIQQVNAHSYYQALNHFFDYMEKKYHMNIIIAAHPKSDYRINPFEGRKILKYKTAKLVKNSTLVFCHCTTSISFAVLYNKPIFIMYTDEYASIYRMQYMPFLRTFADLLEATLINIERFEEKELKPLTINQKKYTEYCQNYLKTLESQNRTTQEIVIETLLKH